MNLCNTNNYFPLENVRNALVTIVFTYHKYTGIFQYQNHRYTSFFIIPNVYQYYVLNLWLSLLIKRLEEVIVMALSRLTSRLHGLQLSSSAPVSCLIRSVSTQTASMPVNLELAEEKATRAPRVIPQAINGILILLSSCDSSPTNISTLSCLQPHTQLLVMSKSIFCRSKKCKKVKN